MFQQTTPTCNFQHLPVQRPYHVSRLNACHSSGSQTVSALVPSIHCTREKNCGDWSCLSASCQSLSSTSFSDLTSFLLRPGLSSGSSSSFQESHPGEAAPFRPFSSCSIDFTSTEIWCLNSGGLFILKSRSKLLFLLVLGTTGTLRSTSNLFLSLFHIFPRGVTRWNSSPYLQFLRLFRLDSHFDPFASVFRLRFVRVQFRRTLVVSILQLPLLGSLISSRLPIWISTFIIVQKLPFLPLHLFIKAFSQIV